MEFQHATRDGCLVVSLVGGIDRFSLPQVQRTLRKHLGDRPAALVCDLSGVEYLDPMCAGVFSTVANHPASRWPDTSFVLCGARPAVAEVLERAQVSRFLPLYEGLEDALGALFARPPYLRDELWLTPTPTAPAAARTFVRQLCQHWRLADPDGALVDRAVLLASELVTNAVLHARTDLRLRLELRGERLHLAVRDGSPRLLRLVPADAQAQAGRGLLLVERLARAWGVTPHPDGGKVVWCILTLDDRPVPEPKRS
jgi:anti-anti-sigma factor